MTKNPQQAMHVITFADGTEWAAFAGMHNWLVAAWEGTHGPATVRQFTDAEEAEWDARIRRGA